MIDGNLNVAGVTPKQISKADKTTETAGQSASSPDDKMKLSDISSDVLRARYLIDDSAIRFKTYETGLLIDEYIAQDNYGGPNVDDLKAELERRGLPTDTEELDSMKIKDYSKTKARELLNEYIEQRSNDGPDVAILRAEFIRRGLEPIAENPERFKR